MHTVQRVLRLAAVMALAVLWGAMGVRSAEALTLAEGGRSAAKVWVKTDAPPETAKVAEALAGYLRQMSGAEVPVAKAAAAAEIEKGPAIVLGGLAADLGLVTERASQARDGFHYKVSGGRLLIAGESPQGVYNGVYTFLESLGCGWYTPGKVGEVIPSKPTITVPNDLDHAEVSNTMYRNFWGGGGGWNERNKAVLKAGTWRHAWGLLVPKELFKEAPELFSLNGGKRTSRQLCTTNPETIRTAAEALIRMMDKEPDRLVFEAGPNDGGSLCECENCRALDTPDYLEPSTGLPACTDRVFKFASDCAEITSKKHPDKYLGVYVYSEYSRLPLKLQKLHPNVFPMIAPIRRCRLHGPGQPGCEWNQLWLEEIQGWAKLSGKLGFYIYNYNLADTLVPTSRITFYKRLADVINQADVKMLAMEFETINNWAQYAPHFYLSARLCWNTHLDVDAEMERFYAGFYGEAAAPMKRYWTRIDRATAGATTHTGSQYGLHHIWTDDLLAASRQDLAEAKALAKSDRVKEAVAMADTGLACGEAFMGIWKDIGRCGFLAADRKQADLKALIQEAAKKKDPPWIMENYGWGYYSRFVGRTVDGGAKVLKDGGRVLVRLPETWKFAKDEKKAGEAEGWWKADFRDDAWQDFGTFQKSWDDQGLGRYQGDGWYRVRFKMSDADKAADLRLWFGGFDYNVDVYLNGRRLGEKKGFATPAEFDKIAEHLKFGGENVLAVRVSAGDLAELGTGGIMMPVMIYAAGKGGPSSPQEGEKKGVGYQM